MEKQKTIRLALWAMIGIIILLLLRWCEGNGMLGRFKPNTDTLIVHKRDTIRDTISIVKMKKKRVLDYIEIPVHDTVFKFDSTACYELAKYRVYNDTTRDKNVVIYSTDTVQGYLKAKSLSYKLLVPLKIYDSVKIEITKKVPELPKWQLQGGLILSPNAVKPVIDFTYKRNSYLLGYDVMNKQVNIGFKYIILYNR